MEQFYRGVEMVMHSATLIAQHNEQLEAANTTASERKSRKRRRIQKGGTLSQEQADDIKAQKEALALAEVGRDEERRAAGATRRWIQVCKQCGKPGHNRRTCSKDTATPGE
jgi:hypothetical protein